MAGRHVAILYVCLLTVLSPLSAAAQQERPRAIPRDQGVNRAREDAVNYKFSN